MALTGGCFCGVLRFEITGEVRMRALCLCRTCQKISGGAGNLFMGLVAEDFHYTAGEPKRFSRDPPNAPTREFCAECGVHIAARSPKAPDGVVVKVGALDEPAAFVGPQMVFWTEEKQNFHIWPDGVNAFSRLPSRE